MGIGEIMLRGEGTCNGSSIPSSGGEETLLVVCHIATESRISAALIGHYM